MKQRKGFTLIELMIVVAIIAFLSVMSVPRLMKTLAKARRTEAYINLRALADAEKVYWAEHGTYTKNLTGSDGLSWKPDGALFYTYGFSSGSQSHVVGLYKTPASTLAGASVSRTGFTIYAAGNIYGEKPDILSIDERNNITIISDALAD